MSNNHRLALRFLYVLLFLSFVAMSLAQPVAGWISNSFGGWVTGEAVVAYAAYLAGLIWLINRVNKAAGFEPLVASSGSSDAMSESDFIRNYARQAEDVAVPATEPAHREPEREPQSKS